MEPAPASSRSSRRRRWQFSLTTLFLFMTIACVVLSRFYPRMYVSAQIRVPTMTAARAPNYCERVLSDTVVYRVSRHHPHLTEPDGVGTPAWFRANVEVRHVKKDILEIRMSGRPGDYDRMLGLVDAIAAEYVDHITFVTRMSLNGTIAFIQEQHDEMAATVDQLAEETEEMADDHGMAKENSRAKLQALRQVLRAVSKRLEELKALRKQSPQVIHRDSGWVW